MALIESQLINMVPKEIGANRTVGEHQEYHTFIIFSNVNDKTRNDILTYLSKAHMFLPLNLYRITQSRTVRVYSQRHGLKIFMEIAIITYSMHPRNQQSMADHKGSGTFTWLIMKDLHQFTTRFQEKGT